MAQFDVFINTNSSTQKQYPLLIDVQHSVLSALATRIVIPLSKHDFANVAVMDVLMPEVLFDEEKFVLMTPQMSSIPSRLLTQPVGTLEHCRAEIIGALDFAVTGV